MIREWVISFKVEKQTFVLNCICCVQKLENKTKVLCAQPDFCAKDWSSNGNEKDKITHQHLKAASLVSLLKDTTGLKFSIATTLSYRLKFAYFKRRQSD
ncbi:hypothetical protein T01_3426 [Trichinella spiralis]|uniref:Uncharacterized protein n=1 Tax=Trichinella spiralis TaxID=6334 RepID=A0A0V1BS31_TRISP|nr:hypothetical protein T01_3426 [Trichinella spiralis]